MIRATLQLLHQGRLRTIWVVEKRERRVSDNAERDPWSHLDRAHYLCTSIGNIIFQGLVSAYNKNLSEPNPTIVYHFKRPGGYNYPISCETSSGGYLVWENVKSLQAKSIINMWQEIYSIYKRDAPFQTLNIFPANFIVQYVGDLVWRDLFSSRALMNTVRSNSEISQSMFAWGGNSHTQPS